MKQILIATILTTSLLGGCATMGQSEIAQTRTLVLAKCPVLKQYSPDRLKKAASELRSLPDDSEVAVLLTDYSKLRDACRAITKELKSKK